MKSLITSPLGWRRAPILSLTLGLAALLATACAAAPGGGDDEAPATSRESSTPTEADLVGLLPADATTVGFIDFAKVRDTEFYAFIRGDESLDIEEFEEFIARTGMDPRTDLHRVAYASSRMFGTFDDAGGMLVQASFDRARVEESIAAATTEQYSGRTLWHVGGLDMDDDEAAEDTGSEQGAESETDSESEGNDVRVDVDAWLAILSDSVIAMGDADKLRAIIDVVDGAPNARDNDELMGLLQDVDPAAQMWIVSAQEGLFSGITPGEGSPMGQIGYDRVNALIVSVDLSDGINFRMRGRTAVQEDAKNLGDALNGMLALGKMMLQGNSPEVFEILDRGVEAGSSGRDVTVNALLSMDDIRVLRDYADELIDDEGAGVQIGG